MGWLSLCVCGTKSELDDDDRKRAEKNGYLKGESDRKKSKRSKKLSKHKESQREASLAIGDSSCKLRDEKQQQQQQQLEKEIAERILAKVNYPDDVAKRQVGADLPADATKVVDDPPSDIWRRRSDDRDDLEEDLEEDSLQEDLARSSADEPGLTDTRGIDYDNDAELRWKCAPMCTAGGDEKRVKCAPGEGEGDKGEEEEEEDPDESASEDFRRSAISGEPEDSSWTSEVEDKPEANVATRNLGRRLAERTSSRINFSNDKQASSKKTRAKEHRRVLPPIKRTARAESPRNSCADNETRGSKEARKLGSDGAPLLSREQSKIRRKLNSCSFEVRPPVDDERVGKGRTRPEGSLIPRLASPLRQGTNFAKSDSDQPEIVLNGTSSLHVL